MFDELNYFDYDVEEIEQKLKAYFKEMPNITDEQVEERADIGKEIFNLMLMLMFLAQGSSTVGMVQDIDYYTEMIQRRYTDIVDDKYGMDSYYSEHIDNFALQTVNTTLEHITDEYYTSQERALNIAENEANSIANYADYRKAVESGKTGKKWLTQHDKKVRKTHNEVDGEVKPIDKPFIVGASLMMFPHDESLGADAKEIIHCRCHIDYLGQDEQRNLEKENEGEKNPKPIVSSPDYAVKSNLYDTRAFQEKMQKISDITGISKKELTDNIKEMLTHRSGTNGEDIYWYDTKNNVWLKGNKGKMASCAEYTDEMKLEIAKKEEGRFISFHNHPASMPPSYDDFNCAKDNQYRYSFVIGHDGSVYSYNKPIETISKMAYNSSYTKQSMLIQNKGLSEKQLQSAVLEELYDRFRIEWSEL